MAKCTFWYQLNQVVPDKVQTAVKWLCVCVHVCVCVCATKTIHWLRSFPSNGKIVQQTVFDGFYTAAGYRPHPIPNYFPHNALGISRPALRPKFSTIMSFEYEFALCIMF